MEDISKTLYDKALESAKQFAFDLKELLHKGSYQLKYLSRHWETQKVTDGAMDIGDFEIAFNRERWEIIMPIEDNPINAEILKSWDKQTIARDIKYHQEKLDTLLKLKDEQDNEE